MMKQPDPPTPVDAIDHRSGKVVKVCQFLPHDDPPVWPAGVTRVIKMSELAIDQVSKSAKRRLSRQYEVAFLTGVAHEIRPGDYVAYDDYGEPYNTILQEYFDEHFSIRKSDP